MQDEGTFLQNRLKNVMNHLSKIEFTYSRLDHVTCDGSWNTDNFPLEGKISSRNRIYLPLSGEGFGKMRKQTLVFKPGFIYLIPPFTNMHVSCNGFLEKYYIHFNARIPCLDMDLFSYLKCPYELPVENPESLVSVFLRLLKILKPFCLKQNILKDIDQLESNAAMVQLIMPFLRAADNNLELQNFDDNRIVKIQQFIEMNLDHLDLLKMLAGEFQLNPNYLSNYYKDATGLSLLKYISSRRLSKAVSYLVYENYQIKEIAWRLGYDEPRSFARFFRKMTGFSPESYRQKFKPN